MERVLYWWQHIPNSLEPVALSIGSLPIYWYALFFLAGSLVVYWLAGRAYLQRQMFSRVEYRDFAFWVFVSALVGGKIGFLLLYWWPFLSREQNFFPQEAGGGLGLPGMSFVGGMIAVTLYIFWYAHRYQKSFFTLTDVLVPFIPIGILFGRLGSFVHGELIGRVTEVRLGMYFQNETVLRHPSTLYAALLEGVFLFVFLLLIKKRVFHKREGTLSTLFCIGYGFLRFIAEFFREPDRQIGYFGMLTLNQIFAVLICVLGGVLFATRNAKNRV